MRFSVIVPVYNVELYIEQCIRSIGNQKFPVNEFEILVVDDCSPDNSICIVQKLRTDYANIRIIKNPTNLHLGGARNTGIREAYGDWILFVDSDDMLTDDNVLRSLSDIIDNAPSDITVLKSNSYTDLDKHHHSCGIRTKPVYLSGIEYLTKEDYLCNVWTGCYLRHFIQDHAIYFREHIAYEDTDWSLKVFHKAASVATFDYPFYSYRYNLTSITNRPDARSFIDNIKSRDAAYDYIKKSEISGVCKEACVTRLKKEVLHLIKTSRNYPYSDSIKCVNYIRSSTDLLSLRQFKPNSKDNLLFFFLKHLPKTLTAIVLGLTRTKRFVIKLKKMMITALRQFRINALKNKAKSLGGAKLQGLLTPVIIAPHPDDEVIGCGGLIARFVAEGRTPHIVIMTGGEGSHNGCCSTSEEEITTARRRLTRKALDILGVPESNIHELDFPDGGIDKTLPQIERLKTILSRLKPDSVFVPHWGEGWNDHVKTAQIVNKLVAAGTEVWEYCVWMWYYNVWRGLDWKNAAILRMTSEEHRLKLKAMDAYIKPLAPCGNPWSGVLPKLFIEANQWDKELYFKVK